MKQIEMIKAFAILEGALIYTVKDGVVHAFERDDDSSLLPYNPITDLALNCAARDKYEVEVDYDNSYVSVSFDGPIFVESFNGMDNPCYAVIKCILKSRGLWND